MTATTLPPGLTPPPIAPVPDGVHRPQWSVMIPTYNCAKFLRQTLESVLAQDPGPEHMQIEVIDDCSTQDDPEAVVREIGKGRVAFYRKPKNQGAIANFNTCIERSRGHFVHILHGDDWVAKGFYQKVTDVMSQEKCGICFVRSFLTDEEGEIDYLNGKLEDLREPSKQPGNFLYMNRVFTPGVVVRRIVYEKTGGFLTGLVHTADWEMWVRAISASAGIFINQPLAFYRFFSTNDTGRLAKTGQNIDDMLRCGKVFSANIPEFSEKKFRISVCSFAYAQAQRFKKIGDDVAYGVNLIKYKELSWSNPLKAKIANILRALCNKFGAAK